MDRLVLLYALIRGIRNTVLVRGYQRYLHNPLKKVIDRTYTCFAYYIGRY